MNNKTKFLQYSKATNLRKFDIAEKFQISQELPYLSHRYNNFYKMCYNCRRLSLTS